MNNHNQNKDNDRLQEENISQLLRSGYEEVKVSPVIKERIYQELSHRIARQKQPLILRHWKWLSSSVAAVLLIVLTLFLLRPDKDSRKKPEEIQKPSEVAIAQPIKKQVVPIQEFEQTANAQFEAIKTKAQEFIKTHDYTNAIKEYEKAKEWEIVEAEQYPAILKEVINKANAEIAKLKTMQEEWTNLQAKIREEYQVFSKELEEFLKMRNEDITEKEVEEMHDRGKALLNKEGIETTSLSPLIKGDLEKLALKDVEVRKIWKEAEEIIVGISQAIEKNNLVEATKNITLFKEKYCNTRIAEKHRIKIESDEKLTAEKKSNETIPKDTTSTKVVFAGESVYYNFNNKKDLIDWDAEGWEIENGQLSGKGVAMLEVGDWENIAVEAELDYQQNSEAGLIFRVVNKNNYYAVICNGPQNKFYIQKIRNGKEEVISNELNLSQHFKTGKNVLKTRLNNSKMSVSVNGKEVLNGEDYTFSGGVVGVYGGKSTASFSGFRISAEENKKIEIDREWKRKQLLIKQKEDEIDRLIKESKWESLFDGTFEGWKIYKGNWSVPTKNNEKVMVGQGIGWIYLEKKFSDFILSVDFKINDELNDGGIDFRKNQMQIWGMSTGNVLGESKRPMIRNVKYKEWNSVTIYAHGEKISIKMNDEWILHIDKAVGSYSDEFLNKIDRDTIGFEVWTKSIYFKNIKILDLKK